METVYTREVLETLRSWEEESSAVIAASIKRNLKVASVFDVGCGPCCLLRALQALGLEPLYGLDSTPHAQEFMPTGGTFLLDDLTVEPIGPLCDLVICFEVLEHIDHEKEAQVVDFLVGHTGKYLVVTAAPPGQPGVGHVNCQPREHWIGAFTAKGLRYKKKLVEAWQQEWRTASVVYYYTENLMIFEV